MGNEDWLPEPTPNIPVDESRLSDPSFYDEMIAKPRGRRANPAQFVRGFGSDRIYSKAHAWNPKNKRAICGVVILHTQEPPQRFSRGSNDCGTCARQWDWWVERGLAD